MLIYTPPLSRLFVLGVLIVVDYRGVRYITVIMAGIPNSGKKKEKEKEKK